MSAEASVDPHTKPGNNTAVETAKDFTAGVVSGFVGKVVEYPFDTVKVLLQTQDRVNPQYKGAVDCFTKTVRHVGFGGLYKGLLTPLLGSCAETATLFVSFGWMRKLMGEDNHKLSLFELSLCGAGSGVFVSFVLTPVELVKCRLQVQQSTGGSGTMVPYKSPLDVIRRTVAEEGIQGMFRGHTSTLMREIPGNFAWFGVYETVCHLLAPKGGSKQDLNPLGHMAAGAAAGVGYWSAFFPGDVVKSKIQTDKRFASLTFAAAFKRVFREEGVRGLYSGWGVTVARAAPSHALIFAVYEMSYKMLSGEPPF